MVSFIDGGSVTDLFNARLDELDRRIVAALQVNGRATWQQVARAVGSTESTVARRAQRLIDVGAVRVTAVTDPIRCGFGQPVLVQIRCEPAAHTRVAAAVAARADVRFLTLVTGTFDLLAEVIVASRRDLAQVLVSDLHRLDGVRETTTDTVLRTFKTTYDWSRSLLAGSDTSDLAYRPSAFRIETSDTAGEPVPLDELDLQIIAALGGNGRRSIADLATELDASESMARRRLERLVSTGCLWFSTLVDPALLGFEVELFVWLRVELARLEQTAGTLAAHPQVRYLSATAGYSDLVCEVVLHRDTDLYDFVTTTLGGLPGLRDATIGLELEVWKRAYQPMTRARNLSRPRE
jgi:DNA-binding Lrp family transcriptional regulator